LADLRERDYWDKCIDDAESGEEAIGMPNGGSRNGGASNPLGEMSFMG
jgi:hypothetical protein